MINEKQMMVLFYLDYLKVSQADSFGITNLAGYLSIIYGGITVSRGNVYGYLGMDLDYGEKVIVRVHMVEYLNNVLKELP